MADELEERWKRLTKTLYYAYGSDSGYLFGIPPEHKLAVEAIVRLIVNKTEEEILLPGGS